MTRIVLIDKGNEPVAVIRDIASTPISSLQNSIERLDSDSANLILSGIDCHKLGKVKYPLFFIKLKGKVFLKTLINGTAFPL